MLHDHIAANVFVCIFLYQETTAICSVSVTYIMEMDGLGLEITQRSLGSREPHIAETTAVEIATTASRIATAYFLWLFTCGISKDHIYLL
jgi:hypothetical protein